jgi:hypothetical protein
MTGVNQTKNQIYSELAEFFRLTLCSSLTPECNASPSGQVKLTDLR